MARAPFFVEGQMRFEVPKLATVSAAAVLGLALVAASPSALATTFVLNPGSTISVSRGCLTPCPIPESPAPDQVFGLAGPETITGTIDLDDPTLELTFSLDALVPMGTEGTLAGGALNGVALVEFGLNYSVPAPISLTEVTLDTTYQWSGQTATVSGFQRQRDAGGAIVSLGPYQQDVEVAGVCTLFPGSTLFCAVTFGPMDFTLDVGTPPTTQVYFQQRTQFLAAIPEPGTGALLGAALAGLIALRRRLA